MLCLTLFLHCPKDYNDRLGLLYPFDQCEPRHACIYTAKKPCKIKSRAFPFGVIPPQNGGNVENAIGIERQKGRAARKRVWILRVKRIKDERG